MRLQNRNAIITGASQGLGFEIAKAFLAEGASLLICARDRDRLNAAVAALQSLLPAATRQRVIGLSVDIADEQQVKTLCARAVEAFPAIDIVVNNAGVYGPKGPLETVDAAEWVRAIQINLIGPFYVLRYILPHMKQRGYGKIVNLSGGGATAPLPNISAYAASKAGLVRLTETLAEELRTSRIDVNAIAPGALNTRFLDEVLAAGPERVGQTFYTKAIRQKAEGGTPLVKGAELTVFLASSDSDGITGKLISALWDPWPSLKEYKADLVTSDIYTLRRILPKERGKTWGER